MERGAIPIATLDGGIDLTATLESGQSYCWRREDGLTYEPDGTGTRHPWYYTLVDPDCLVGPAMSHSRRSTGDESRPKQPELIRIRRRNDRIGWTATTDAEPLVRHLLRLDDDLRSVGERVPDHPLIDRAWTALDGLRIVRDPPFRSLISFICSAQMRVSRIFDMQVRLAETLGPTI